MAAVRSKAKSKILYMAVALGAIAFVPLSHASINIFHPTDPVGADVHIKVTYQAPSNGPVTQITLTWSTSDLCWEDGSGGSFYLDNTSSVAVDSGPPWAQVWGAATEWDITADSGADSWTSPWYVNSDGSLYDISGPNAVWTTLESTNTYCIFGPVNSFPLPLAGNNNGYTLVSGLPFW